jgi:hypothetical protein
MLVTPEPPEIFLRNHIDGSEDCGTPLSLLADRGDRGMHQRFAAELCGTGVLQGYGDDRGSPANPCQQRQ